MEQVQAVVDLVFSIISMIVLLSSMGLLVFMVIKSHKAEKEHQKIMKQLEEEYALFIENTLSTTKEVEKETPKDKEEVVPKKRGRKPKKVEE